MTFATEDLSIQPGVLRTPKCGYDTAQKSCTTFLPTPISKNSSRDVLSVLDPNKFLWLSPASTVSTGSSLADFNDMWDSPETPTKRTTSASSGSILTPLTPPTPPNSSKKLLLTPISKPFFGVGATPAIQQPFLQEKGTAEQDDPFQPKLFRGVTLMLEEISKASVAAATIKYNSNPIFVFTQDTSVSSRTRSKTASTPIASAIHTAIHKETSSIGSPRGHINPPVKSKFAKLLEKLIPHDLHSRLASAPACCAASLVKSPSQRCSYMAKPQESRRDVVSAVKDLAKFKKQEDYCGMLRRVKTIVQSVMCNKHQGTALNKIEGGSRISQLRNKLEDRTHMTNQDYSALTQWVDTISDLEASTNRAAGPTTIAISSKPAIQVKQVLKPKFKVSTTETTVRFSFSCSSGFIPYQPKKVQKLSVFSALYEKATSPLGPKDMDSGFVYLFWDKAYFGIVKIRYTNDLATRLKAWNTDCKRKHYYHSSAEIQVEMPHMQRVEHLIHTELKECRLRRQCEGCGRLHREWFQASEGHVVKVMKKWREWIQQKPYVQDEESGEWVLKPEMLASLEQMCKPLPQDVATQRSGRKSGGIQRGSQKRKSPRRTM
ncbi:T5orf172 multi-domain protein [Pyrenophora tritici-repentis]|nr:T5orf172 multi-domain protein [Pyrenophora tritici-repentis]